MYSNATAFQAEMQRQKSPLACLSVNFDPKSFLFHGQIICSFREQPLLRRVSKACRAMIFCHSAIRNGQDDAHYQKGHGVPCNRKISHTTTTASITPPFTPPRFVPLSKRRRGYPSETKVKRGHRVVHGDKELQEKLGRRDLCPCGSGRLFKHCCLRSGRF